MAVVLKDLYVKVPQGTTVRDTETGRLLGDLIENGQTLVVAGTWWTW